jgi:pyruvate,orthophosphate dikinase
LEILRELVEAEAKAVFGETGVEVTYLVGTMIELPRACLVADEIAEAADFFSFGTNDLTQTTFGVSRDDAGNFLPAYERRGILKQDPFISLDPKGVGQLVALAVDKGRQTRESIKLGICGEHGGDPASIRFCEGVGLDYVSCSPFRVPIARLAAAQAALAETQRDVCGVGRSTGWSGQRAIIWVGSHVARPGKATSSTTARTISRKKGSAA